MKMSTQKIRMAVMLLLCVLLAPLSLQAQNVTVHPGNGSMMPALKSGNTDTFYGWGGFATWKHEQLSLTMTTGDSDNNLTDESNQLTSSGQLAKPANDIFASSGVATFNYITFVSGGTTYYLNAQGRFTTEKTTTWEVDDDGYVHSGSTYLTCSNSGNPRTLSTGTSSSQRRLRKDNSGRLYYQEGSFFSTTTYYLHGTTSANTQPTLANNTNGLAVWTEETVSTTKCLQLGKGGNNMVMDTYLTIALPKGYRFTGYTIQFHRINRPNGAPNSVNETSYQISFGETDNTFTYTSTTNSTDDNLTTYYGGIPQGNTTQHTISRTSDTDMENVLYFKLSAGERTGRAFIQLDFVELYFTAEHNTPTLIPAQTATEVSAVDIPFTTSKIDYGQLIMRDIDGHAQGSSNYDSSTGRMSYDGTIRDMNANMTLYEKGSVETITAAQNDFDGTAGDIVKYYQSGHSISSAGDFFKLESSKHPRFNYDDGEAIYYIESPIWAVNSAATNPHKNPIGYRIVSAKFNYGAGTGSVYLPATFKIQFESTGHGPNEDGTYGLNVFSGNYNWNPSYHTVWRIDQDGYIYGYNTSNGTTYYLAVNGSNIGMTTTKPTATNGTFEVVNNQIRLKSDNTKYIGWNETVDGQYVDDNGYTNDNVTRYFVIAADEAHRSTYNEMSAATTGTHGEYVLKIYGPDGETVAETINVGEEGGSVTVTGYNNDAIKIGVVGTALINAEITMQALDPYIDRLDIVCQESGGTGGKLTQQFSATDFAVKGGKFTFYVPQGFPAPAKFTFENLYSHYGDETYYGNTSSTNHARYFFVKSPYEQTAANVYNRNNADSYTTKILTEKVGSTKFTFNNASTVGSAGGWFEEYAFSPSNYTGSFNDFTFSQTEMTAHTVKTAYLFTCDEPRYNIAPTTATQHVYYAFYEMKIDMQTKTYVPVLEWEKVYDETYDGGGKTDSKWGLTLTTTETVDDHGRHSGYLTVTQIIDAIDNKYDGVQGLDSNGEDAPKSKDQILYVDGSKLMSIVENQTSTTSGGTTTYTSHPKSELKAALDKNALIYLPYGSKSSDDNFAFNTIEDYTKTPIFRGANNFVMTDKYAFYAPYDIQVDAAKMAYYERKISKDTYGKVQNATLIMPFKLNLEGGTHTNEDGTYFTLHKMQTNQSIELQGGKPYAYFPNEVADVSVTVPHTPYMVRLDEKNSNEDQDYSFVVSENGTLIKATTGATTAGGYNYYFTGETSTGTVAAGGTYPGGDYTLTNQGTYAGQAIDKTKGVFYFARDRFVNSAELASSITTVKIYPFRSYYKVGGSARSFSTMNVIFGQNDNDIEDAIRDLNEKQMDMSLRTGKGTLTITSAIDNMVRISGINGVSHYNLNLSAGETKTVSVPAGIYIVNGAKILVK